MIKLICRDSNGILDETKVNENSRTWTKAKVRDFLSKNGWAPTDDEIDFISSLKKDEEISLRFPNSKIRKRFDIIGL